MLASPTLTQVVAMAASLGIAVDPAEGRIFQVAAAERLRRLDDFLHTEMPETSPPLLCPAREGGHRPSLGEDPFRSWTWRCCISSEAPGPLAGKTVSIKDHLSVAGIPQGFSSAPMDGFIPDYDATVVTRILAAGGTILGKTAMDGFFCDDRRPVNPHDAGRLTGGSSSGAATALSSGQVDISIGGDQGGSIRYPAAYCGVLGLKPTFSLVSHFGASFGFDQSVDHVGPMAREVDDLAAALAAIAGYDELDPRQRRSVPDSVALHALHSGVRGLRIGVLEEGFDDPIEPEVRDGVLHAVEVLADAGAVISKVSVPEHRLVDDAYLALALEGAMTLMDTGLYGMWAKTYYPASAISSMDRMWRQNADQLPSLTKLNQMVAAFSRATYHGAVYAKAQNLRPAFTRAYDSALTDIDVLVMPTVRNVAPPIGTPPQDPRTALAEELHEGDWMAASPSYNLKPFNYTGHPALAVPCGKSGGLPMSMQLVGRPFADPLLLQVAYAFQQSVDWEAYVGVDRPATPEEVISQ